MFYNKKFLLRLILIVMILCGIEIVSFILYTTVIKDDTKDTIRLLCGQLSRPSRLLPNTFWHHDLNPDHPEYSGIINAKGTKGDDFVMPKPEGELRIICVGDSSVEGTCVRPKDTFPEFLEEKLRPVIRQFSHYKTVKVINAGVGSHNSAFNLAYLEFRLIHYNPDIVIIKSSYNDYLPYIVPGMRLDYSHAFPRPFHLGISNDYYWRIARYSYFLKVCGLVIFREKVYNPYKDFSGELTSGQFKKMDFSMNKGKFYIYAENIRSMILLCKGRNIKVMVLDLPTSQDPNHYGRNKYFGMNFRNLIRCLDRELKRVTSEEDVPFVITEPLDKYDFCDHCHNTASGNKKIAIKIYDTLLKAGL